MMPIGSLGSWFGMRSAWRAIVDAKLLQDKAKIPKDWILAPDVITEAQARRELVGDFFDGLLDAETLRITVMDAPELLKNLGQGQLTATQVTIAFSKRAAYAHQISNLLLEICFDSALEQAQALDRYFDQNHKLIGPLHGLPITLKDQFHIKGVGTSAAYVGWIDTFEGEKGTGKERVFESELIEELKLLGAVPIGKTSLVTSTWAPETNNNILGYALNPFNQRLSAGGSSGGESVMQALRGSVFGFGTDSGGSISMPSSYQGLFSLKPSSGRISFKGGVQISPGNPSMPAVVGILGRSVTTLRLVLKSLLSTEPWTRDPFTLPIPWRSSAEYDPEKETALPAFGFFENDGIVTPQPPISRAMTIVKNAMMAAGYDLVDWHPPSNNESMTIHGPLARGDGCVDAWKAIQLSGEPLIPELAKVFPKNKPKDPISLLEYEGVVLRMKKFREDWRQYWESSSERTTSGFPVQAVISPVTPYAGFQRGQFMYSPYTSTVNVLDYASVVIPVTFADKDIDSIIEDFKPLTDTDKMNMETYDPEIHHGAPASVQLIGRQHDEERLLSMAQLVINALEKYNESSERKTV